MDDLNSNSADLEEKISTAVISRFIVILHLATVLSQEELHIDALPKLKKQYLGNVLPIWPDSDEESDISTVGGREWYWTNLLIRWAGVWADERRDISEPVPYFRKTNKAGESEFIKVDKESSSGEHDFLPFGYIPCYRYNKNTGEYDRIIRDNFTDINYFKDFINLDDFKEYIEKIERGDCVQLPLPSRLYSDDLQTSLEQKDVLLEREKQRKKELIKIATRDVMWPLINHLIQVTDNFKDYKSKQCRKEAVRFYQTLDKQNALIPIDYLDDDVFNEMQNQHRRNIVGRLISKMLKDKNLKVGNIGENMKTYNEEQRRIMRQEKNVI